MTIVAEHLEPDGVAQQREAGGPLQRHPILISLAAITVIGLLIAWFMQPYLHAALAGRDATQSFATKGIWLTALLAPLGALVRSALFGLLGYALAQLAGGSARYGRTVGALMVGEVAFTAGGLFTILILALRGVASITSPDDLMVRQGLDLFVDVSGGPLLAVAQTITLPHVIWFVVAVAALTSIARFATWAAIATCVLAWLGMVAQAWLRISLLSG
jgi:hypothetical protein